MNKKQTFTLFTLFALTLASCVFLLKTVEINDLSLNKDVDRQGLAVSGDHQYVLVATGDTFQLYDRSQNFIDSIPSVGSTVAVSEHATNTSSKFWALTGSKIVELTANGSALTETASINFPAFNPGPAAYMAPVDISHAGNELYMFMHHYSHMTLLYTSGMFVYDLTTGTWSAETMLLNGAGLPLQNPRVIDTLSNGPKMVVVTGYSVGPGLPDAHNEFNVNIYDRHTLSWEQSFELEIEVDVIDVQLHANNLIALVGHTYDSGFGSVDGAYLRIVDFFGGIDDEVSIERPAALHSESIQIVNSTISGNAIWHGGKDSAGNDVVHWSLAQDPAPPLNPNPVERTKKERK